jgi:anti-anti-sigma regulatory factor
MSTSSRLTVGRTRAGYLITLEGRGTLFQSPAFQELVERCLDEETSTVVVSFAGCDYLDSTFLGSLVSLHRTYNSTGKARLQIDAPAELRKGTLHTGNLDRLLSFADERPRVVGTMAEVEITRPGKDEIAKSVEQAHRLLSELDGGESSAFGSVAQRIAQERAKD